MFYIPVTLHPHILYFNGITDTKMTVTLFSSGGFFSLNIDGYIIMRQCVVMLAVFQILRYLALSKMLFRVVLLKQLESDHENFQVICPEKEWRPRCLVYE